MIIVLRYKWLNSKTCEQISAACIYSDFSADKEQKIRIQFQIENAGNYYPICVYEPKYGDSLLITNSWTSGNNIFMEILNNSGRAVSGNISIILIRKSFN